MSVPRPSAPAEFTIVFLYVSDLDRAMAFYEDVMGFTLAIDQGWSKIYRICPGSHVGLVDERHGMHRAADVKPVQLCLRVPDVAAWHAYARDRGVANLSGLIENDSLGIRAFVFDDPEGYQIEIQTPDEAGRMTERALIVINPNSSEAVTAGIDAAMDPLRALGTPIRCVTLAEGPPGIESQSDADLTIAPMLALAARLEPEALGYVIACFGDPGLHALRDRTARPVLGIQEAAVATALTLGQRFGVIAILPASIPRHRRAVAAMGLTDRLAGDRALGLGVAALADADTTLARMVETGRALVESDGADVLIMGCAGMAGQRAPLARALGVPVVEPCQAAAAMAVGRVALGLSHRQERD